MRSVLDLYQRLCPWESLWPLHARFLGCIDWWSWLMSVYYVGGRAKTAEQIDLLFGMKTSGDPVNTCSHGKGKWFDAIFAKVLCQPVMWGLLWPTDIIWTYIADGNMVGCITDLSYHFCLSSCSRESYRVNCRSFWTSVSLPWVPQCQICHLCGFEEWKMKRCGRPNPCIITAYISVCFSPLATILLTFKFWQSLS